MVEKSPEAAKSQAEARSRTRASSKTESQHKTDLTNDFAGQTPKYFVSFDAYGTNRILQEVIGNQPEQRFLVVGANGRDYQLVNGDTIVKQVRTYFKNNKEGLRKTLFDLGYMTERDYTTRSEQALTTSIIKVANEYTIDTIDSFRIDGKTKFPGFTNWLSQLRIGEDEDGPRRPYRDINMVDRDVVKALVEDVYMETNMQLPDDPAIIEAKVDRYMDMIKKGTVTKYKEPNAAGEDEARTGAGFSEARLRAELGAEIPKEQPIDYQKAKSINFLSFLNGLG
jgi:hypothetical protein